MRATLAGQHVLLPRSPVPDTELRQPMFMASLSPATLLLCTHIGLAGLVLAATYKQYGLASVAVKPRTLVSANLKYGAVAGQYAEGTEHPICSHTGTEQQARHVRMEVHSGTCNPLVAKPVCL